jgi:hypothetical protein
VARELNNDIGGTFRRLRSPQRSDGEATDEYELPHARLEETNDVPEGQPLVEGKAQPQRLLGELSRASESLAEVLDGLTAEKRELESRAARLEHEVERAREEAAAAQSATAEQVERMKDETAARLTSTARDAARSRARADRAERLLTLVGGDRQAATFSVTVGRLGRRRAARELLTQAVSDGVHVRLSAHHGWRDSLLVAEVEGPLGPVREFLTWARNRFAEDQFRETQT